MRIPNLRGYRHTDLGCAEAVADRFAATLRFCPEKGVWLLWRDCRWDTAYEGEVLALVAETMRLCRAAWEEERTQQAAGGADLNKLRPLDRAIGYYLGTENWARLKAILATVRNLNRMRLPFAELDASPWLLGVRNGHVDLKACAFSVANPSRYLSKSADVVFDAGAVAPKWEKFIAEILCGEEERIEALQRVLGYSLTGSVEEQVMFMCVGGGANGKSTMMNVIRRVMGDYAKVTPFNTFSGSSKSEQTNDLAALAGSRFVAIAESDEDSVIAEAKLKAATGGDPITCRFLNKEFFSYIPQFKVWMSTNQLPVIRGMNDGNFRRQVIFHFRASFNGAARVNDLEDQLVAEGPGILNWLLEGLKRWHTSKLSQAMPKALADANREYRAEMDMVGKWLEERCEVRRFEEGERVGREWVTQSRDLFTDYMEYMKGLNHKPKSHKTWAQEMRTKGFVPRKSNGLMVHEGLRIQEFQQLHVNVA